MSIEVFYIVGAVLLAFLACFGALIWLVSRPVAKRRRQREPIPLFFGAGVDERHPPEPPDDVTVTGAEPSGPVPP